jgi:predicted AAA+ superfamily ATPase
LTNFANIARDCGVDAKTVKEYCQILVDTLLGTFIEPYKTRQGEQFGRAFEHFILMEILAHRSYRNPGYDVHYWRTKSGLEVDFVLGRGEVAIEVKGASRVDPTEFRGLRAFVADHRPRRAILVCDERSPRIHHGVEVLPWREFLGG